MKRIFLITACLLLIIVPAWGDFAINRIILFNTGSDQGGFDTVDNNRFILGVSQTPGGPLLNYYSGNTWPYYIIPPLSEGVYYLFSKCKKGGDESGWMAVGRRVTTKT